MMKKMKECLWFLIPFLSLTAVLTAYVSLNTTNVVTYINFLISEPFFIITFVYSFVPTFIISVTAVLIYKIALRRFFKKTKANRAINYFLILLISLVVHIVYFAIWSSYFDRVLNALFTLLSGISITFVFWFLDILRDKVSEKKLL